MKRIYHLREIGKRNEAGKVIPYEVFGAYLITRPDEIQNGEDVEFGILQRAYEFETKIEAKTIRNDLFARDIITIVQKL